MKLIKVKCPKNKKVEVEDLGTGAARCPAHCPLKQRSRCFNNTFRYTAALNPSVTVDVPFTEGGGASTCPPTAEKITPPTFSAPSFSAPTFSAPTREAHTSSFAAPSFTRAPAYESAPAREEEPVSTIGYAFPDEKESGVIGYEFPSFEEEKESFSQKGQTEKRSTLDKYNDALTSVSSLFAGVRTRSADEPCFEDGAYVFYEGGNADGAGNSAAAIRYIFQHWYVSKVFEENGKNYREEFLYLLKLRGFKDKEAELRAIVEDAALDVNRKFFRLFYSVIYQNQINGFYWHEGDSPFRKIPPKFLNLEDFFKKLAASLDPSEFLQSFENCFDELTVFLQAGKQAENGKEWFKKNLPLMMAERENCVSYVDETDGKITLKNLGGIKGFIQNMAKPATVKTMSERYRFLREFKITVNGRVLPREQPLPLSSARAAEDDGVYESVGLFSLAASQCATAYNYYVTLLKEYMDVFHPDSIRFANGYFSCRNFYEELLVAITDACAHLSEERAGSYPEVQRLYVVKSFFDRGVFDYFETRCETKKLQGLKKAFVESEKVDLETYFRFEGLKHFVTVGGERKTVGGYFKETVKREASFIEGNFGTDKIARAYFAAKIPSGDWKVAEGEIEKLLAEQQKLVNEF